MLADFSNTTGDPVFDDTLKQAIAVQLGQSPFLNILSDAKVRTTLKLMAKPRGTKLTPEVARDLCQRAEAKAYVSGAIASLGSQYVIGLDAINCKTGDVLAQEQVTADNKEHVLKALASATAKLRRKLGESLSTVEKFDRHGSGHYSVAGCFESSVGGQKNLAGARHVGGDPVLQSRN